MNGPATFRTEVSNNAHKYGNVFQNLKRSFARALASTCFTTGCKLGSLSAGVYPLHQYLACEMSEDTPYRCFVGYDTREDIAFEVYCKQGLSIGNINISSPITGCKVFNGEVFLGPP